LVCCLFFAWVILTGTSVALRGNLGPRGDGPDEGRHFAGDRNGDEFLVFPRGGSTAM
jgi:hypothetical protein